MSRKRKSNLQKIKRSKKQIGGLNQQGQRFLDPKQPIPGKPLPDEAVGMLLRFSCWGPSKVVVILLC